MLAEEEEFKMPALAVVVEASMVVDGVVGEDLFEVPTKLSKASRSLTSSNQFRTSHGDRTEWIPLQRRQA